MAEMRREKDSLGMVEVPAVAMYGAQTQRAVENYPISGMRAAPALIRAIGMVKKAAAEANGELGVVSEERAEAIAAAAQEVIEGKWDKEFVVDVFQAGAGVSFHMNANEVVSNRANQLLAASKVLGTRYEVLGKTRELGGGTETNTGILRSAQNDNSEGVGREREKKIPPLRCGMTKRVGKMWSGRRWGSMSGCIRMTM